MRSEPVKSGGLPAPLNRSDLDRAGPWLRLAAGAVLIAWSTYTTITGVQVDLAPMFLNSPNVFGISVGLIVGLLVAAIISLIEWLTSERLPLLYAAALLVDARYTEWQIGPWIEGLAKWHLRASEPIVAQAVALVVSWCLALAIARYGELLLFGRRR